MEPAIRQVPGVGDINAFGGGDQAVPGVRQAGSSSVQHGVTLPQVFPALQNNNSNTGGNIAPDRRAKPGRARRQCTDHACADIEKVGRSPITTVIPIYVRDVAEVRTGMAPRQGIVAWYRSRAAATARAAHEVDDVVEGIVLAHKGTNALRVVEGREGEGREFTSTSYVLPPGVQLVTIYDRTDLVDQTVHTVMHNLIEGGMLILIISLMFTSSLRAALVIWLVIPLSLLSAFHFPASQRGRRQSAFVRRGRFWHPRRCGGGHRRGDPGRERAFARWTPISRNWSAVPAAVSAGRCSFRS